MSTLIDDLERDGFAIVERAIDEASVDLLLRELESVRSGDTLMRAGKAFGIRNLLNVLPAARALTKSPGMRSLVDQVLGSNARVVRGIYFDKHKDANWKVAWHQDLTIAVRQQMDIDGYGPWSIKAGIHHVQPPVSVLENMLTVRLHLDHTDESNGALRVLPGSHKHGRLEAQEIQHWKGTQTAIACPVTKSGVMLMRPLLLHASSAASNPSHRRVLHFEYSSSDLPVGLEWFDCLLS
jgi:hypothetical protein